MVGQGLYEKEARQRDPEDDRPGRFDVAAGTTLRLGWDAEDAHYFDHATGQSRDEVVPVPA